MYDILQLNDMLVPELLDIAEQLHINDAKNLGKQDLIFKILDKQAVAPADNKPAVERPKRKRIIKAAIAGSTEQQSTGEQEQPAVAEVTEEAKPVKKVSVKKVEKPKKAKKKTEPEAEAETPDNFNNVADEAEEAQIQNFTDQNGNQARQNSDGRWR